MKKIFAYFLALLLLICCFILPAQATGQSNYLDSGSCGDNARWMLTHDGELIIQGTGPIKDFSMQEHPVWHEKYAAQIKYVTIGEGITSIGNGSFGQCINLISIRFPSTLNRIGFGAFGQCTSLTELVIPDTVTELAFGAFYGSTSLKTVVLPNTITTINMYMFSGCTALETVVIPATVTSIGATAFDQCTSLQNVIFEGTQEQWNAITVSEGNDTLAVSKKHYDFIETVTKEPTCTSEGVMTYTCSCCADSFTYTTSIPRSNDHRWQNATCEKAKNCPDCGMTEGDPLGHQWDAGTVTKEPTCTETGTKTTTCARCHQTKTADIPTINHNSDAGTVTKEPTCEADGVKTFRCTMCRCEIKTESISALGHIMDGGTVTKEPTCTQSGEKITTCTRCQEHTTATVPATGHKWDDGEVTTKPTCTETGEQTITCQNCQEQKYESIPMSGHNWMDATCEAPKTCADCRKTEGTAKDHTHVEDPEQAATCTETGLSAGIHCADCNKVLMAQNKIPALGHTDEGEDNICDVCQAELCTVHDPKVLPGTPATCIQGGLSEGSQCNTCGQILKAQVVLYATGHDRDDGKITQEPTCSAMGVKTYTCRNCQDIRTVSVASLGHRWVDATCEKAKHCSVCNKSVGRPLGHNWTGEDCETVATCSVCKETQKTAPGHKWEEATCLAPKTCSVCGKTEGKALGHDWKDATCEAAKKCTRCNERDGTPLSHKYGQWVQITAPTATATGLSRRTCEYCKKTEDKVINALGQPATEPPTEAPTEDPTEEPTEAPTEAPTEKPTEAPTEKPTEKPDNPEPTTPETQTPTEPESSDSTTPSEPSQTQPEETVPTTEPQEEPNDKKDLSGLITILLAVVLVIFFISTVCILILIKKTNK